MNNKGMIKLAHFSIKEYLMSDDLLRGAASFSHFTAELSHSLIAQTCLAYLLQFDTFNSLDQEVITESSPLAQYAARYWMFDTFNSLDQEVIKSFPLAQYAARYWIFHAHNGGI